MIAAGQVQHLRKRWKEMEPVLNEQSRRRWAATEAKALGRGGVSCVVRVTGLARRTVYRGLDDIRRRHKTGLGRIRERGGGRKPKIVHDPTLLRDLKTLVEPATRGDPMKSLLWTSRSLRKLSKELANKGHEVSHTVVGELLQQAGYSCRRTAKPAKATSIWIETRNFSTSMRAPFARAMAWDTSSSISFAVMIFML